MYMWKWDFENLNIFSSLLHSYSRTKLNFPLSKLFPKHQILFQKHAQHTADLGDTFGCLQRMFSTSTTSGKVQITKNIFHVQVEGGFSKFEFFQFHSILNARLNPTFLCPNEFQNIKYHSKNMCNVFYEVRSCF